MALIPSESKPSKSNNEVISFSWYLSINSFSFSLSTCAALFVELVCPEKSDRVVTSNKNGISPENFYKIQNYRAKSIIERDTILSFDDLELIHED